MGKETAVRALLRVVMSALVLVAVSITMTTPAQPAKCPPEVASAKAILMARGGEMQASHNQNVGIPRNQGVQAGRSEDVQSPRNQDVQAPRNQENQSPRNQDSSVLHLTDSKKAEVLVKEAEAACQAGDTVRASEKAMAALDLLRR